MSEKQYFLDSAGIEKLRVQLKGCRDAEQRIRLLCIYWVGQGKTAEWVSECMLINVRFFVICKITTITIKRPLGLEEAGSLI